MPKKVPCYHLCMNKRICGHECCKNGVIPKPKSTPQIPILPVKELKMKSDSFNNYMSDLKSKLSYFPDTPKKNRIKVQLKHVLPKSWIKNIVVQSQIHFFSSINCLLFGDRFLTWNQNYVFVLASFCDIVKNLALRLWKFESRSPFVIKYSESAYLHC